MLKAQFDTGDSSVQKTQNFHHDVEFCCIPLLNSEVPVTQASC